MAAAAEAAEAAEAEAAESEAEATESEAEAGPERPTGTRVGPSQPRVAGLAMVLQATARPLTPGQHRPGERPPPGWLLVEVEGQNLAARF